MKKQVLIALLNGCTDNADAPEGLRLVCFGQFTAVFATDTPGFLPFPSNRQQALRQIAHRQAQLEHCMKLGTVLPVKPDTHLDDPAVRTFLAANEECLTTLSQRVHAALQFQIMVKWNPVEVLNKFREAPEIKPLFSSARTTAPALQAAVSRLATRLHAFMQEHVSDIVEDMILLPHAEDVIFNAVVMVAEADTWSLDLAVERIDAIWPEGFVIRQIGPAPASSFALIDPVWTSENDVADAYAVLGVAPGADSDEIVTARRAALMKPGCDPDHLRAAADTVHAASRLGHLHGGFHRCVVRSDGQSASNPQRRNVA